MRKNYSLRPSIFGSYTAVSNWSKGSSFAFRSTRGAYDISTEVDVNEVEVLTVEATSCTRAFILKAPYADLVLVRDVSEQLHSGIVPRGNGTEACNTLKEGVGGCILDKVVEGQRNRLASVCIARAVQT